jgi:Tfp pilus assembly protein PilX
MTPTVLESVRRRGRDDEGAALMLTVFTILLVTTMSLTVGSAVLLQVKPTQLQQKTTRTLTAAEAGFDVALNRIRAARDAAGNGVRTQLPCTATAGTTITGLVGAGADASGYSVRIRYYADDPSNKTAAWRSSNANLIACTAGSPSSVPAYALLESTGSGSALKGTVTTANRTVEQTYKFRVTNVNIPGGQIVSNTTNLCLTAASHANNAAVRVNTCDSTGANILQKWSYTTGLLLQTVDNNGQTYCIQATSSNNSPALLTSACSANVARQVWSFNDIGRFAGATANGSGAPTGTTNGWCLTIQNDKVDGSIVYMKQECGGTYDSKHTFNPEAKVGAGAAGDNTRQLVNYSFFGRCLDITGANRDANWLIGYPCKQAPSAANITWNQKFTWDAVNRQLCTNTGSNTSPATCAVGTNIYCLTAGTNGTTPASGIRVVLDPCSATNTAQKWTRRYDTGAYATSYNILTASGGLCLDLNPTGASEANTYDKQWGIVLASTCDGSTRQKWNAPADLQDTSTINTYEHS